MLQPYKDITLKCCMYRFNLMQSNLSNETTYVNLQNPICLIYLLVHSIDSPSVKQKCLKDALQNYTIFPSKIFRSSHCEWINAFEK